MLLKEKEYDFWKSKNVIYELDTAIKKSQVHQWNFKNLDLHDLFIETLSREFMYFSIKVIPTCLSC